jgi:hypothetical protein
MAPKAATTSTETRSTRRTSTRRTSTRGSKAATPWGEATIVDEVALPQRAGERRFTSLVQLLEDARGERLVRFAYATEGTARRGPVTLRVRDLAKLHDALRNHPELAETLVRGGL